MSNPSVILLDIETSPIMGYTWGTYEQSVLKVLESSKIISIAWKELGENTTHCKALIDYKGYKKDVIDDTLLVKEAWKLLDGADVVIAHHGDAFDIKKLNARFVYHGLTAPSAYKTVDTLKVAKKYFAFDSNSLNSLANYFGLGQKIENGGFSLWVKCIAGEKEAWDRMKEYNIHDVVLLEKIYLALRPFMDNHPNLNATLDNPKGECSCPTCLSTSVVKRGFAITRTGRKQRFQCNDCGAWSSGPYEKIKAILVADDD